MNKMILIMIISLFALCKSSYFMKELSRGLIYGYNQTEVILNETCFDNEFDEDYIGFIKSIEEENYSLMSLKIYKIALEVENNCNKELREMFTELIHFNINKVLSITTQSSKIMPPLIRIYNSDTKTPYEYGVVAGELIKILVNI